MTSAASGAHEKLSFNTVNITQGGYVYVYLSNEGQTGFDVYFDDLSITHTKGAILQEDHYYPFGLNISALSSTAPLSKPNNYKFNGNEEQTEFDLNLYDFNARMYDATLGRFANIDPLADVETSWTPYRAFYDNPISYSDPSGLLEFANHDAYKAYAEENGLDVLDANEIGSQGHWLKSDRLDGTSVWDDANWHNIRNGNENQYEAFSQIRDLYKWVRKQALGQGHEVRWMMGADLLVSDLPTMRSVGTFLPAGTISLLEDLNTGIANFAIHKFKELLVDRATSPITGSEAYQWDLLFISQEQGGVWLQGFTSIILKTIQKQLI